ncbi:MAG: hypothetical protein H6719_12265 [Sandaracinaceae bacterium]|nr:hypothetical protein [Sandaracinaceae bacterium]
MSRARGNLVRMQGLSSELARALESADRHAIPRLAQAGSRDEWAVAARDIAARDIEATPAQRRVIAIELALRDKALDPDHPIFVGIAEGPAPLQLLPFERSLLAQVTRFGGVAGVTAVSGPAPGVAPKSYPLVVSSSREVTNDDARVAIESAVASWVTGSNGTVESRVFAIEAPHGRHAGADVLTALGLAAIPAGEAPSVEVIDAAGALARLFTAARGGAYCGWTADASARDLAWTSLRGLLGVAASTPAESVATLAQATGFVSFLGTSFFHDVAWDLGLAVVPPSRDRLAILAATDTD